MYRATIFMLCLGAAFCYEARNANFMQVDNNLVYRPLGKFVYKACNKTAVPVLIKNLDVKPEPIQPGGKETISADIGVSKTVAGNIDYQLQLNMYVDGDYMDLCPYVPNYCNGKDVCAMMEQFFPTCPPIVVKTGFNCRCPVKPGNFKIPPITVNVPEMLSQVEGQFQVIAKLTEGGSELMCAQAEFCIGKC